MTFQADAAAAHAAPVLFRLKIRSHDLNQVVGNLPERSSEMVDTEPTVRYTTFDDLIYAIDNFLDCTSLGQTMDKLAKQYEWILKHMQYLHGFGTKTHGVDQYVEYLCCRQHDVEQQKIRLTAGKPPVAEWS